MSVLTKSMEKYWIQEGTEEHPESAPAAPVSDHVNHPSHYANKQIEVIDYIRDTLTKDGYIDYCLGNVIKYVSRWRRKGGVEDLEKANVYLNWAIEGAKDAGELHE